MTTTKAPADCIVVTDAGVSVDAILYDQPVWCIGETGSAHGLPRRELFESEKPSLFKGHIGRVEVFRANKGWTIKVSGVFNRVGSGAGHVDTDEASYEAQSEYSLTIQPSRLTFDPTQLLDMYRQKQTKAMDAYLEKVVELVKQSAP